MEAIEPGTVVDGELVAQEIPEGGQALTSYRMPTQAPLSLSMPSTSCCMRAWM
jgi:hypothetical protein